MCHERPCEKLLTGDRVPQVKDGIISGQDDSVRDSVLIKTKRLANRERSDGRVIFFRPITKVYKSSRIYHRANFSLKSNVAMFWYTVLVIEKHCEVVLTGCAPGGAGSYRVRGVQRRVNTPSSGRTRACPLQTTNY